LCRRSWCSGNHTGAVKSPLRRGSGGDLGSAPAGKALAVTIRASAPGPVGHPGRAFLSEQGEPIRIFGFRQERGIEAGAAIAAHLA
ncbi:MAG: hypothetical protein ACREC4_10945, partial [Methylocella sp.]